MSLRRRVGYGSLSALGPMRSAMCGRGRPTPLVTPMIGQLVCITSDGRTVCRAAGQAVAADGETITSPGRPVGPTPVDLVADGTWVV